MAWSGTVDISKYIVAAAPFGGPIGWYNIIQYMYMHIWCTYMWMYGHKT